MDLEVETTQRDGVSVLSLQGEIDVYTAPRMRQAIVDLIDAGSTHIVIDMERVDFLDSTGLGVLVEGLRMIRPRGGSISIVVTQDKIVKVFDITGLNKEFSIHGTLEEALQEPVAGG